MPPATAGLLVYTRLDATSVCTAGAATAGLLVYTWLWLSVRGGAKQARIR